MHVRVSLEMAAKAAVCVLCFSFFALGGAKYCYSDSDCDMWSGKTCCLDSVCRVSCYHCSYNYQCGRDEVCCDGDCLPSCTGIVWTGGAVAGIVVGSIVFLAIICAGCPYYRYRSRGTLVVLPQYNQPLLSTQVTTTKQMQMQRFPPPGNYNQPPPDYCEAPLPHPRDLQPQS